MENKFSGLSKAEINKLVAIKLGNLVREESMFNVGRVFVIVKGDKIFHIPDYCNSWADMGPLIESSDISLINDESGNVGAVTGLLEQIWLPKECALRAAAEVYLMMKDTK